MTLPFGPEELRVLSRDYFVGNECDTDEYRETQPAKGMRYASDLMQRLEWTNDFDTAWIEVQTWVAAAGSHYEGADELHPVLARYHDVLWAAGEHPYYDTLAELIEFGTDVGDLDADGHLKPKEGTP